MFTTKNECMKTCQLPEIKTEKSIDVCSEDPEVGNCDAKIGRSYYDKKDQKCKYFWYSGCGGTLKKN